jgi:squalene-hopene/tetraprenyl-beta-curcumene cyclase
MRCLYDRTDLLWAATELPGLLDANRMQQLVELIFKHQKSDGGWSIRNFARLEEWGKGNRAEKLRAELEFPDPPSDGHMTGVVFPLPIENGLRWAVLFLYL